MGMARPKGTEMQTVMAKATLTETEMARPTVMGMATQMAMATG